jgi:hypothetical protein
MNEKHFTKIEQIEEAMPMGAMSRLGQQALSQLPTFAPQTATKATGTLETGKLANQLMMQFQNYLGKTGQKPTKSSVTQFLSQMGYPTDKALQVVAASSTSDSSAPMGPLSGMAQPSQAPTQGQPAQAGRTPTQGKPAQAGQAAAKINIATDQRILDTLIALKPQQLATIKQLLLQKAGPVSEELDEAFMDKLKSAGSAISTGIQNTSQALKTGYKIAKPIAKTIGKGLTQLPGATARGVGAAVGGAQALGTAYQKGKQTGSKFVGRGPFSIDDLQKIIYSAPPAQAKQLLKFVNQLEIGQKGGKTAKPKSISPPTPKPITPPVPAPGSDTTTPPPPTIHESDEFRKLLTIINEASDEPVLSSKQVSAMILASAQEAATMGSSSNIDYQASSPQSYTPQVSATTSGSAPSSQGLGAAFKAGFSGDRMPNSTQSNRLDFSDKNSTTYVLQQLQKFAKSGGKLDPKQKESFKKLIEKL